MTKTVKTTLYWCGKCEHVEHAPTCDCGSKMDEIGWYESVESK